MSELVLTPPTEQRGDAMFARGETIRRQIRRWWVPDPKRWVAWLMLNPSVAGNVRSDPTAQRVTHFSRAWGYDGWIGVNLYPFVSSMPADMWRWADWANNGPDWYARDDICANFADIERVARAAYFRVVAFGAEPACRDPIHLDECLEHFGQPADSPDADDRFWCLGVSGSGQPLHPMARGRMRVPDDARPLPWRRA